ncbi:uncharacterized protein FIBRA_07584 [Fibroporia radiculosa]|uniref:RING-type domain-containing protein n=1 Tax=Fibroporia radiculosa TaxID=599839 RepID=J4H4P9_9APHY|nr:uncharacterized protein FIBRA_07584 [Fibroporia radiculosa]CCM05369.1 predicted protein [Fibroporia radiculosa]
MSPLSPARLAVLAAVFSWAVLAANAQGGGSGQPNTSLAMIILYAITGCVSALFCIVIVSGVRPLTLVISAPPHPPQAIRAIRHPERYGPRPGDPNYGAPAQSRARGLTRAILDTFPVVKFGGDPAAVPPKDVESPSEEGDDLEHDPRTGRTMELRSWEVVHDPNTGETRTTRYGAPDEAAPQVDAAPLHEDDIVAQAQGLEGDESSSPRAGSSRADAALTVRPRLRLGRTADGGVAAEARGGAAGVGAGDKEIVPDAIGRETCPICIVDFEEGDDLRVLPCEGHHRFHCECVDQWLLELSSSCPICRQDFQALETMMAGNSDPLEPPHMPGAARPLSTAAARFSRYLRFARRRHDRRQEDGSGYDITDPPMPIAPEMHF